MPSVRCIGCGFPVDATRTGCAHCETPVRGAARAAVVEVPFPPAPEPPAFCCCCLAPAELFRNETVRVAPRSGSPAGRVGVPWCRACRNRRTHLFVAPLTAFVAVSLVAILGMAARRPESFAAYRFLGELVLGGVAAAGMRILLKGVLPNRPGHVANCLAWEGGTVVAPEGDGRPTLRLMLRNEAFAALWRHGAPVASVQAVRSWLLAECERLHGLALARQDSNPGAGRGIREGILKARAVIESAPGEGPGVAEYLDRIQGGLEQARADLDRDSDDEDGWGLGGLRSVANAVDELARIRVSERTADS